MVLHRVAKSYRRLYMYGREHKLAPTRKTSVKFCECEELYLYLYLSIYCLSQTLKKPQKGLLPVAALLILKTNWFATVTVH